MRRNNTYLWQTATILACALAAWTLTIICARGEWVDYNPPGSLSGNIMVDIESRCDGAARQRAFDPDRVTYTHELTHQLNSIIRNKRGPGWNAAYVGGGRAFVAKEPNLTLAQVARLVPQSLRNSTYELYLVEQRKYWDANPLYVLDEWVSYKNGSRAARELKVDEHGSDDRFGWFCSYADALLQAIEKHDPGYQHKADLIAFVEWCKGSKSPPDQSKLEVRIEVGDIGFADLAPSLRIRNKQDACVHASTTNLLLWLGLTEKANAYWSRYKGGEHPSGHKRKLDAMGIRYAMTTDGDERLLEYAVESRRGAGVTWSNSHVLNLMGRENGNAVLLGNNVIDRYHTQPWNEFLKEWRRCGGWAFVILDGVPPPPTPK